MSDLRAGLRRLEKAYFRSGASRLFAELMSRKARHLYRRVIEDVGPLPVGAALADFGCGHGTFLAMYLAEHPGVRGWGIDQSAELIAFASRQCARQGVSCAFSVGDLEDPLDAAGPFDVAVSCSSIYCWQDPVAVLDRIHESLEPGARLLVYDQLPVRTFRQAHRALFLQRLFGLGLPAWTRGELEGFAARSRFRGAKVEIDELIIRLELTKAR